MSKPGILCNRDDIGILFGFSFSTSVSDFVSMKQGTHWGVSITYYGSFWVLPEKNISLHLMSTLL